MGGLTKKQEDFCLKYAETGNASEAYRFAYRAEKMKPETINVKSSELLKNGKVTVRVDELKSAAKEIAELRFGISISSLFEELEEARQAALSAETVQASAAVSATMSKAKLCGFDINKHDHISSDGSMSPKRKTLDDFYSE